MISSLLFVVAASPAYGVGYETEPSFIERSVKRKILFLTLSLSTPFINITNTNTKICKPLKIVKVCKILLKDVRNVLSYMSNTRDSVSSGYPNTKKRE